VSYTEIKEKAIRSSKWAFLAKISQIIGSALTQLLLPYWLLPSEYGIISIFSSIMALALIIQQTGLIEITQQEEAQAEKIRDASFFISIVSSLVVSTALFLFAPLLSSYFTASKLSLVLRAGCVYLLLGGISNIPLAWLQRNFQYRTFALIQLASAVVNLVSSISLAMMGKGYWAYVIGLILGSGCKLILTLIFMDWKPRFITSVSIYKNVFSFSAYVFGEMILGWFFIWFDNIAVAKNLGSAAAGIYTLTFNISTLVISLPCSAITGVTLASFSRLQNDISAIKSAYMNASKLIMTYAIPASVGLAIIGPTLAKVLYPGRWDGLQMIIPILAIYSGTSYLWILNTDAFKAIGKPEIMVKIYLPVVTLMIPIYWYFSKLGLVEFAIARSFIVIIGGIPHTYYAIKLLQLPKTYLFSTIRTQLPAGLMMGMVVGALLLFTKSMLNNNAYIFLLLLAMIVAIGIGSYVFGIYWLDRRLFKQVKSLLRQSFSASE
jgi:O-antigen/teichoic acid export membrane protein